MNEKDLFRALGDIDDDLIEAAGCNMMRRRWRPWMGGLVAACLCMVALALRWDAIVPNPAPEGSLRSSSETLALPKDATGQMWSLEKETGSGNQSADASTTQQAPESLLPSGSSHAPASAVQQAEGFRLTWPGGSYDSTSGILTEGIVRSRVPLTQAQQERILALADEAVGSGEGSLTRITAAGEQDETLQVDAPAFLEILNILHGQD